MKMHKKTTHNDVLIWTNEAKLDLPDRWESIQQNLPQHQKPDITVNNNRILFDQPIISRKKLLITCAGLAVLILIGGVLISGQFGQWFWPSNSPENHYSLVTASSTKTNEPGKPNTSASTYSEEQLAFSDKANAQFALMEQAHITDQYKYYAGCYIEDLQTFIINVTCKPEEFKAEYADILDFSIIEVRQVKYTLKELESAYAPLYQEFTSSDKLAKLGVFGMAVFEQDNAIRVVVQSEYDNISIRKEIASIITDTGMIVFEVDGKVIQY